MKVVFICMLVLAAAYCSLPECPEEIGDDVVQFPNPEDCSTFYKCNGTEPVLIDCEEGTWYNPEVRVCDWPENIPEGICKPPVIDESE